MGKKAREKKQAAEAAPAPQAGRLEEPEDPPRPARELRERGDGERGAEPGQHAPEAPPGGAVGEGGRRRLVQQQEGEHERDPPPRGLGRDRGRAPGERRELENREGEQGEAGEQERPAREGPLPQVDRPADGPVARVEEIVAPLCTKIGWSSDFKATRIEAWARRNGVEVLGLKPTFPGGFVKILRMRKPG